MSPRPVCEVCPEGLFLGPRAASPASGTQFHAGECPKALTALSGKASHQPLSKEQGTPRFPLDPTCAERMRTAWTHCLLTKERAKGSSSPGTLHQCRRSDQAREQNKRRSRSWAGAVSAAAPCLQASHTSHPRSAGFRKSPCARRLAPPPPASTKRS